MVFFFLHDASAIEGCFALILYIFFLEGGSIDRGRRGLYVVDKAQIICNCSEVAGRRVCWSWQMPNAVVAQLTMSFVNDSFIYEMPAVKSDVFD